MATISASVGRDGTNRQADVAIVQELLNRVMPSPLQPLKVDGMCGPKTIVAIEEFQRRVVLLRNPDGRVDPAGRTIAALNASPASVTPATSTYRLPVATGGQPLGDADYSRAATTLRCEVACIRAVVAVESGASGFFASGRPKILFEAHVFSRHTQHRYDLTHPDLSSRTWNRALYRFGEAEYGRLERAIGLDAPAALSAASWGRFQIMGFNHRSAGFANVETFVAAMYQSEGRQLDAFIAFLQSTRLDAPLRERRWADFARGYNGAGYAANHYDTNLAAAYARYAR